MSLTSFYKNKVVIITGSSRGIGKELARQILTNGGKVTLTGRDPSKLKATAKEFETYSDSILIYTGDVTNHELNQIMVKKTVERFGRLDILITNAGLSCYGELEMSKPGIVRYVTDTNIYGTVFPIMASIPELKKTQGSILMVSSIAGFHGVPGYTAYSLSKMSLKALAQSLRIELRTSNIFVGIAYLGFTKNENDKKTYNSNGTLENVPDRPLHFTRPREETSLKILNQIKKRRHSKTHSFLGNLTQLLSRYIPSALHWLLSINYRGSALI